MSLYLKWLLPGRVPFYQGGASIPVGEWTDTVTDPVLCERGWHACRWEDAVSHIATELWVCELDGTIIEGADKVVAQRLRLIEPVVFDDRALRLFAADCAEKVLPIFEAAVPGDDRPRNTVEMARRFANGNYTRPNLDVAWDAAWDAAWAAARAAARDAQKNMFLDAVENEFIALGFDPRTGERI